jgi:hypothetical protein
VVDNKDDEASSSTSVLPSPLLLRLAFPVVVLVTMKAGRNACDIDEPTSPSTKHNMATDNNALCAAAWAPPNDAAVAAHELCHPILTVMTNKNGTNDNSCLIVSIVVGDDVGGDGDDDDDDDVSLSSLNFVVLAASGFRKKPRRFRTRNNSPPATTCDNDVAHAAPAMPMCNCFTRIKSPNKFMIAARKTAYMGVDVSFVPIHTACAIVVKTTAGNANALMLTYD